MSNMWQRIQVLRQQACGCGCIVCASHATMQRAAFNTNATYNATTQLHARAAGVVGTWYYQTNNVPPNPTKEVNCSAAAVTVPSRVGCSEQ